MPESSCLAIVMAMLKDGQGPGMLQRCFPHDSCVTNLWKVLLDRVKAVSGFEGINDQKLWIWEF